MRALKLLLIIFIIPALSFAQELPKNLSIISAEGTGKMTVSPDQITTFLTLVSKGTDYNKVVHDLNNKASLLEKQIVMAGFRKEDLKTTSYTINRNIVWVDNRNVDSGFVANQGFIIEFENNNQKIASFVKTISEGKTGANFNFSFGLSERKNQEVTNELIRKAVGDATQKSKILAEASGVKIKKIHKICYGSPPVNQDPYNVQYARMNKSDAATTQFSGFNVQDIKLSDTVVVEWEIE